MPEMQALLAALNTLLPQGTGAGCADPRADLPAWPGEALPQAVPARRREFAAGRQAARAALAAIGAKPVAIPQGADRAPIWPPGLIGSITHTGDACLAIAAFRGEFQGMGLDLEPATPLDRDLWDSVLLPQEQMAMMRLPAEGRGLAAKRAFCAKEAAFKAQYPLSNALFGFEVMTVTFGPDRFAATFQTDVAPFAAGHQIQGRMVEVAGHFLALALI